MRRRLAMALLAVAVLAGGGAVALAGATRGIGAVPMKPAPQVSASASSGSSSGPLLAPATASAGPEPTAPPSPAPLQDIDGTPVHITVLDQGTPLIDADVNLIQLNEDGWLNPDPGLAGWYGPPQWQTIPGNLSGYRAVIVGHNVTGEGMKDVFFDLGRVRAGDSVVITYALRTGGLTTAQFAVAADAVSAPKQDVIAQAATAYRWVWQSDGPQRTLALFSCDLDAPHVDGHSVDNWIVTATRVS
ncbi:Sortase family protein [Microbacterium sp. 8M]|uniref:class F sortase n=1 Tax=Microbacterium sp. 8M TaxID=2653153 RepID=UPI0012F27F56|nr:class F sortase [Microbacterium sp. 8M]VXB89392.1 Sortase family protein [Microbacterium sp. 8M]